MSTTHETHDYDPRYERAQTIEGAKARYIQLENYNLNNLESDIERLLKEGEPEYSFQQLTEPEMGMF